MDESTMHPFLGVSSEPPNNGNKVQAVSDMREKRIENRLMEFAKTSLQSRYRFRIKLTKQESPIDESWSLRDIATKYPPFGWEQLFIQSIPELEFLDKKLQVWDQYPRKDQIFEAFFRCPFQDLKVVLIGQDPYPTADRKTKVPNAMGLSFSAPKGNQIPRSLSRIYKELGNSMGVGPFTHCDLTKWAERGVLLLNTDLTVEKGVAGSHSGHWKGFVSKTFRYIQDRYPKCIYILLGGNAQKLATGSDPFISDGPHVLKAGHPSPLNTSRHKFLGSGIFVEANNMLQDSGQSPINWNVD